MSEQRSLLRVSEFWPFWLLFFVPIIGYFLSVRLSQKRFPQPTRHFIWNVLENTVGYWFVGFGSWWLWPTWSLAWGFLIMFLIVFPLEYVIIRKWGQKAPRFFGWHMIQKNEPKRFILDCLFAVTHCYSFVFLGLLLGALLWM